LNSGVNDRRGRGFLRSMLSMTDILPGAAPLTLGVRQTGSGPHVAGSTRASVPPVTCSLVAMWSQFRANVARPGVWRWWLASPAPSLKHQILRLVHCFARSSGPILHRGATGQPLWAVDGWRMAADRGSRPHARYCSSTVLKAGSGYSPTTASGAWSSWRRSGSRVLHSRSLPRRRAAVTGAPRASSTVGPAAFRGTSRRAQHSGPQLGPGDSCRG
jgi:hypothetical protein